MMTARQMARLANETRPEVKTRGGFPRLEADAETKALIDALERDLRAGRYDANGVVCPVCSNRMAEVTVKDITLDACPGCLATWFDSGELAELLALHQDVPGAGFRSRASRFACPRCEGAMREFAFVNPFNLLVDRCEDCGGVLLENGELERAAELRSKA